MPTGQTCMILPKPTASVGLDVIIGSSVGVGGSRHRADRWMALLRLSLPLTVCHPGDL